MKPSDGLILLGSLALAWPAARASGNPEQAPPVVLEPLFVEASSANPWQHFTVPGFEVISHCPDDFNLAYARALQRSTAARAAILPADFWGTLASPMKIVLYNREAPEGQFLGRPRPIDLSWSADGEAPAGSYGIRRSHPAMVGDGDTFINCGNYHNLLSAADDFYVDPDSEVLLRCRVPQFPSWFVEALEGPCGLLAGRVAEAGPLGRDSVVLPALTWMSRAETAAIQKDPKRPRALLPMGELFGGAVSERDQPAWDAQVALFARWGLFRREADGRDHREAFLGFVRAAASQPVDEALFRGFFEMGYAEAGARLGDYVGVAVNEAIRIPVTVAPLERLESRDATQFEIARIVGDWGRLEGRLVGMQNLDYQRECLEQADRLFEKAYARQSSDPEFLAAFGLYALQSGDMRRAREALGSAVEAGVARPRAYLELARLRLGDALPFAEQGIGDLGEADYAGIVALLARARAQQPSLVGSYLLLARAMEHAPRTPGRGDMAALEEGLGRFPRNAALAYKVATLYRRFGYPDLAASVASRALRLAVADEDRARLATFVAAGR